MRNKLSVVRHQPPAKKIKIFSALTIFSLIFIACLVLRVTPVSAQLEIADTYDVSDPDMKAGDLVSLTGEGLKRSVIDYDNKKCYHTYRIYIWEKI